MSKLTHIYQSEFKENKERQQEVKEEEKITGREHVLHTKSDDCQANKTNSWFEQWNGL